MTILLHKSFKKSFRTRVTVNKKLLAQVIRRIELFQDRPNSAQLKDHALSGELKGKRAFSVGGDMRIIYEVLAADTCVFLDIGTHAQVYK